MLIEKLSAIRDSRLISERPMILAQSDEIWTFDRLYDMAGRVRDGLLDAGVRPGDRVALHMGNRPELAIAYLACFKLGAVAAPLNLRFKIPELEDMLQRLNPRAYIGEADKVAQLTRYLGNTHTCRIVVGTEPVAGALSWQGIVERKCEPRPTIVDENAVAVLLGSSGTTGKPKLIAHSQATLVDIALRKARHVLGPIERFAMFAPMVHASGLLYFFAACFSGATVMLLNPASVDQILDGIERHRCDSLTASPAIALQLVAYQKEKSRDVSSLRRCMSGGDVCPASTREAFNTVMGVPLNAVWGSTEASAAFLYSTALPAAYRPQSGVEIRLVDAQGDTVVTGETGELMIRGPNVALGYWDNETGITSFPDGWYATGDAMRQDRNGNYLFVSRIKDLIVRGGSNISPIEVEQVILQHPDVEDAGVIGIPDPELGQRVIGFVQLHDGTSVDRLADISSYIASQLADYKTPERLIPVLKLPRNIQGKLDRTALLKMSLH